MTINISYSEKNKKQILTAFVMFKTSEQADLPKIYGEGSIAYCYEGANKGKAYIFNGNEWVEQ